MLVGRMHPPTPPLESSLSRPKYNTLILQILSASLTLSHLNAVLVGGGAHPLPPLDPPLVGILFFG